MNTFEAQVEELAPGLIVVGVAERPSQEALDWAAREAKMTGRAIALVRAVEPLSTQYRVSLRKMGIVPETVTKDALEAARSQVEELAKSLAASGVSVSSVAVEGDPAEVLVQISASAHRLVVGSRGHGALTSRLLGSVSSKVVRHASCPSVVVRPTHGAHTNVGIVVTASPSAEGQATLEAAFDEAESRRCALSVIAYDPRGIPRSGEWAPTADARRRDEMRLAVAEAVAGLQADHPDVAVSTCVADGSMLHALLDIGGRKELLVVERADEDGHRGRFTPPASLAVSVVEHASTSVMVVP